MLKEEMETTIQYDRASGTASIYTADPARRARLDKFCEEYPDVYKKVKEDGDGAFYECPKRCIKFGRPASETQRENGRRLYEKYLKPKHSGAKS